MIAPLVKDRKNNVYLDETLRSVRGGFLAPASSQNPVTVLAASGANSPTLAPSLIFQGAEDSYTELLALQGAFTNSTADAQLRATVVLSDTIYRRQLMNRDILAEHVFGTAQRPFRLLESLWLSPQQTFVAQLRNNSVFGAFTFECASEYQKFQTPSWTRANVAKKIKENENRKKWLYPFWLTTDSPVSIGAYSSAPAFMTVTKDIQVVLFGSLCRTIPGAALSSAVSVEWLDATSQRPLQNQPVFEKSGSGDVEFPYWFPTGWPIEPNTKIQANFTNLTAVTQEVFWTLFGVANYVGGA